MASLEQPGIAIFIRLKKNKSITSDEFVRSLKLHEAVGDADLRIKVSPSTTIAVKTTSPLPVLGTIQTSRTGSTCGKFALGYGAAMTASFSLEPVAKMASSK